MQSFHFDVMGVNRTYWDFYLGFGLFISVLLFAQAVLLWQLATMAKTDPVRVRPLIASLFLAFASCALLAWKLLFAVPALFAAAVAACLGFAWVTTLPRATS